MDRFITNKQEDRYCRLVSCLKPSTKIPSIKKFKEPFISSHFLALGCKLRRHEFEMLNQSIRKGNSFFKFLQSGAQLCLEHWGGKEILGRQKGVLFRKKLVLLHFYVTISKYWDGRCPLAAPGATPLPPILVFSTPHNFGKQSF